MTIIITCAIIAIIIIAVLVSINVRSSSSSRREIAAAEQDQEISVPSNTEAEFVNPSGTETAHGAEGAVMQEQESERAKIADIAEMDVATVKTREQSIHPIHQSEAKPAMTLNQPTADQDFREAIRRLKEHPAEKASAPEGREKIADDAYRQALRSFMEKSKTEE